MEEAAAILGGSPGDDLLLGEYDAALKKHAAACSKLSPRARAAVLDGPAALLQVCVVNRSQFFPGDGSSDRPQTLNPTKDSIGYLTVLDIVHSETAELSAEMLELTLNFLLKFNPYQVRYVGAMFSSLLSRVGSGKVFTPAVAIELLTTTILRLDPRGSTFTSTHILLARLAHTSGIADASLPVIDADILYYPTISNVKETKDVLCDPHLPPRAFLTPSTGLTDQVKPGMVLEYERTRAMIYISKREWAKAYAALDLVVSHPTRNRGVSKLMMEAHKKWILVGLLHEGKTPQLSFYVSGPAQMSYQTVNEAYNKVAHLFSTRQVRELRKHLEDYRQLWEDDENASLITEVISTYQKWQIVNLREIYQRVSISAVQKLTFNAETGKALPDEQTTLALIQSMLDSAFFSGEIEVGSGDEESYLSFSESKASISEADLAREVAVSHQHVQDLVSQYRTTSGKLSENNEYVKHLLRDQKRLELEKQADAGVGFEAQIEDEDLMTGVLPHV